MAWSKNQGKLAKENGEYAKLEGDKAKDAAKSVEIAIANSEKVTKDNKTRFLNAVATVALRDSVYPNPQHGDTVRVTKPESDGLARTYRFVTGTGWVITDVYNPTAIDNVTAQLADMETRTLGVGTKVQLPTSPSIASLFFLTDLKRRVEYNGLEWQYLNGEILSKLNIIDDNIYLSSATYIPQTVLAGKTTAVQTGIDMTKDLIWYANIKLADNNDFMHFQFKVGTVVKLELSFGINWVTVGKDGASISVYDYSDASKTLLGNVDFYSNSHDVIVWYDHKWGFLNVYVDNVLIGSYKPNVTTGTNLSTINTCNMACGSGATLLTVNYTYMAKPLVTAIGDSITAGAVKHAPNANHYVGVDDYGSSYPKLVSDYLKLNDIKNYFVVNKGVNSDTTSGMLSRFVNDIVDTDCKHTIILGGINDYAANDPTASIQNKKTMANLAGENGIEALILGVLPTKTSNQAHQYAIDLHALEVSAYNAGSYIDMWRTIEGTTINVADDTKMADPVHPNLLGYGAMVDKIKQNIKVFSNSVS